MNYKIILLSLALACACTKKRDNKQIINGYYQGRNLLPDYSIDNELNDILPGVNSLIESVYNKKVVVADSFDVRDTNQILLLPYKNKNKLGNSSGFSDLTNRVIFVCPSQIREFIADNSLGDTAIINGYLSLILLHEISHFIVKVPGSFDEEGQKPESNSSVGEINNSNEQILMSPAKRLELLVDSNAIELIKNGTKSKNIDAFSLCMDAQLSIAGAEFMLFGKRLIGNFGSPNSGVIRDKSWTHPNIELRLAFMNYYLNPTEEKRSQIEDYIFSREVEPILNQEKDPRIYQGN